MQPGQPSTVTVDPGSTRGIGLRFDAFDSAPPHAKTGTLALMTGNPRAPAAAIPLSAVVDTTCVDASRWLYTVDENATFSRFDAETLTFTDITRLDCPQPYGPERNNPNSMAVDQNAVAWVAYNDGWLFKVDTTTGKCEGTDFEVDQHGLRRFGMGFAFDPSTGIDTLYVAGGLYGFESTSTLATVSFPDLAATPVGTIDIGTPELSGTGDGAPATVSSGDSSRPPRTWHAHTGALRPDQRKGGRTPQLS